MTRREALALAGSTGMCSRLLLAQNKKIDPPETRVKDVQKWNEWYERLKPLPKDFQRLFRNQALDGGSLISFSDPVPIESTASAAGTWNPPCDPPSIFNPTCRCKELSLPLIRGAQVKAVRYFVCGFVQSRRNTWYEVPPNWDLEWAIFEAAPAPVESGGQTIVLATFKNWSHTTARQAYIGAVYQKP